MATKNPATDDGVALGDKHNPGKAARGNGGEGSAGISTGDPQLGKIGKSSEFADNAMERPTDNGSRESVSPGTVDKIYTADSKERWGGGQPSFADLLAESKKTDADIRKKGE